MRHFLLLLFFVSIQVSLSSPVPGADSFADELTYLKGLDPQIVGRDAQISAYEQLLAEHPGHPERSAVMLLIADLWQMSDPRNDVARDVKKELEWVRKARQEAPVGSTIWFDAGFRLEGEIFRSSLAEAEQILDEIHEQSPGAIIDVKVIYKRLEIAIDSKRYDDAELLCRELLNWNTESDSMPADILGKGEVFEWIQSGASSLMIAWSEMDAPTETRKQKIESLYEDFQGRSYMESYRNAALEHLDKLPVTVATQHVTKEISKGRRELIWLNVIALAAILAITCGSRFRTSKTK